MLQNTIRLHIYAALRGTGGNGVRYVDDILIGFSFPFLYQTSSSNNSKALRTIRKEFFMRCPPKWDTLMKLVFYLILPINYDGWIKVAILWFIVYYIDRNKPMSMRWAISSLHLLYLFPMSIWDFQNKPFARNLTPKFGWENSEQKIQSDAIRET